MRRKFNLPSVGEQACGCVQLHVLDSAGDLPVSSDTATAASRQVVTKEDTSPTAGFNNSARDEAPTQETVASAANAAAGSNISCESNSTLRSTHTDEVAEVSALPPAKRRKVLTLPRFVPPATTANSVPSTVNGAAAKDAKPPVAAAPKCSFVQTHRHETCNEAPDQAAAASSSAAQDKNSVAAAALAASLQAQKVAAEECLSAADQIHEQITRQAVGTTKPPASTAFKAPRHKQSTKQQHAGSVQKQPDITVQQPAQVPAAMATKWEVTPKGTSQASISPAAAAKQSAATNATDRRLGTTKPCVTAAAKQPGKPAAGAAASPPKQAQRLPAVLASTLPALKDTSSKSQAMATPSVLGV